MLQTVADVCFPVVQLLQEYLQMNHLKVVLMKMGWRVNKFLEHPHPLRYVRPIIKSYRISLNVDDWRQRFSKFLKKNMWNLIINYRKDNFKKLK